MKKVTYNVSDESILDKIFEFLVNNGLENAHIRDICRGTGIAMGSIYYWFGDKKTMIYQTTVFGAKRVMNEVFGSVCEHTDLFADCESVIRRNRKHLCFIYQMVASPIYGEQMRDIRKSYDSLLNKYAEQLSVIYNCSKDITYPIVLLYISAILDYAVWEEKEKLESQVEYIYQLLLKEKGW